MGSKNELIGAKGGSSKAKQPTEAQDSLRSIAYFRIVDLVSEGEIGGLVNGLQSIYLDGTPVANADGSLNFSGVHIDSREGTQDQTYIPGYSSVENEIGVGTELRSDNAWVTSITDTALSALRITLEVEALQRTDTSNGNIVGYAIQFAIDVSTDDGAYQTVVTSGFNGKSTTQYQRSIRVDLPTATTGWNIRVRRLTANANSATIADTTRIVSYTEIIDAKLRYPNSAIVAISGDASQFSNIPARSYDVFGRIIQVPSNYDPTARTYSGTWDGTFQPAWTNNPAWVLYDMITQNRYGMGDRISAAQVDKFELYRIGQYCDQMVDDGKGGLEPRFSIDTQLTGKADAFRLLGDMASVFRGMAYWAGGMITASSDMPSDPVYTYTAANVIDGRFTYQSSARKTRFSTALVTWNDPANAYTQAVEYVEDRDALARYGIQQTEFVAIGCTRQGQARRAGKWNTLTSRLETDSVSFAVGIEGVTAAPGQIIRVQDPNRAGRRQGGRISSATASTVTVDKAPDEVAVGDTLTVNLPSGSAQSRPISSIAGRVIHVSPGFDTAPPAQAAWAVESTTLANQLFRVLSVSEDKSADSIQFTISAVQHVPGKFANVDNGTIIQIPPISRLPSLLQPPPTNLRLTAHAVIEQGIANAVMTIAWDKAEGAARYQVEWQRDNSQWVPAGVVATTSIDVLGIYSGSYVARVTAINNGNVSSIPAISAATDLKGKTGAPPTLTSLTATSLVFGIRIDWGFPAGAEDTQRTEIWYGQTANLDDAIKLGDFAYPQNTHTMMGLAAGASFFFWGRLVDKSGNIGAWYPTGAGVNGQSSSDATEILQYLVGQITETQLAQDLLAKIDAVTDVGDQLAEIAQELGAVEGEVSTINGVISEFNPPLAGDSDSFAGDSTVYAGVWSEQYARAAADGALAKRVDTVAVSAANADALVRTETQARIDADGALASQVTTVQATAQLAQGAAGTAQALAQTASNAAAAVDGKVSASYQIKVQIDPGTGKYVGAGMAIGIDNAGGIVQSQILLQADRFALLNVANGVVTSPFVIQGGQVFINQALIGTGWITNAMIGNVIQSTAVDSTGNPTWKLDKTGQLTQRGSGSGWRIERDGAGARLYDGNGTLRMRWGAW